MKKIITTLAISIISLTAFSQYAIQQTTMQTVNLKVKHKTSNQHNGAYISPGVALMAGGATFLALSVLTPNEGEFVDGKYQQRPFYKQPAHLLGAISGAVLFTSGVLITLGE
jgi:hypothetical protein